MKANELRIGNWLYSGITKEDFIIDGYDILNIDEGDDDGKTKPIKLTEEWLVKFGFEKRITVGHSVQYFIGKNPVTHDWLFDILWLEGYSTPFYRNGFHKIKHVHQLQNLYFALTGEELKIKQQ
jgi:hypothetical protein